MSNVLRAIRCLFAWDMPWRIRLVYAIWWLSNYNQFEEVTSSCCHLSGSRLGWRDE